MIRGRVMLLIGLNTAVLVSLLIINWLWLREVPRLFIMINFVGVVLLVLPIGLLRYVTFRRLRSIEDNFPTFLADFVELVRGGMPIPEAFKTVSVNDYKELSPLVKKVAAQLDWGMPLEGVLVRFGKESGSPFIGRVISSVIESHRHGGPLADTFEALSKAALEVEKLRAERRAYMYSQMVTGYVIFFVFLGVMIGLQRFLIPSLVGITPMAPEVARPPEVAEAIAREYNEIFRNLILIQGFFAGLTVGKLAHGEMIAGLKHSLLLMFVGLAVFSIAAI